MFRYAPKLAYLTATDLTLADKVRYTRQAFEGPVDVEEYSHSLAGISIPDLLSLMSDASHEAMMITDKRGHIVVGNAAWERLTGYTSENVFGIRIGFLRGPLTDEEEFGKILEAIKYQLSVEAATGFLHRNDGQAFLCQLLFIPNIAKFEGAPLTHECLSQDSLEQMALEQAEGKAAKEESRAKKNMKDLLMAQRELSYHFFRFGCLSDAFHPHRSLVPPETNND